MFDLDGTIFVGDRLLPHAIDVIQKLEENNKSVYYVTNTSIRTRTEIREFLNHLGLETTTRQIISAAYVAAKYLADQKKRVSVFVIGHPSLVKELCFADVKVTANPLQASHVLVGMDFTFTYEKLQQGMEALENGATLIGVNPDPACPVDGKRIPDTGSLLSALQVAAQVEQPIIIGKPYEFMGKYLQKLNLIDLTRTVMIGDRLETDIVFGKSLGVKTGFVLTGASKKEDVLTTNIHPDFILSNLGDLKTDLLVAE